jgi:hypothetical protein
MLLRKTLVMTVTLASLTLTLGSAARAEDGALGVDGAVVLPIGDWSDISGLGIGALVAGHYDLSPQLAVTGRVGYIHHLSKSVGGSDFSTYEIPVLGGIKYRLGDPGEGMYLGAEAGLVSLGARAEVENPFTGESESVSDSDIEIGLTAGVGYETGDFDLRGQVFFPSLDHIDDLIGIMGTVGYRFSRF